MPNISEYNGKKFNPQVFDKYVERVPNLSRNELIKNGVYDVKNKYKAMMTNQDGGDYIITPIKGLLDGDVQNYDGVESMVATSTKTFYQGKPVFGRMKAWTEKDFAVELTGVDWIKDIAGEVGQYYETVDQTDLIAVLKGVFNMDTTDTGNNAFVSNHTYDITSESTKTVSASTLNNAVQKACGANKGIITMAFMNSAVATNLENLQLLTYMLYNDAQGIQRQLNIATWNGRVVIVDDELPAETSVDTAGVSSVTISTAATAGDKITLGGVEYTFVANDATEGTTDIKVGASGTASQQATNIATKLNAATSGLKDTYTIAASSTKVTFTNKSEKPAGQVKATATKGESGTLVVTNAMDTEEKTSTNYVTYLLGKNAIEYENIGVRVPSEVKRDPATNGGLDILYTRQRHLLAPKGISYTKAHQVTSSATTAELATAGNWELVHDNANSGRVYYNHKNIAIVKIVSKG